MTFLAILAQFILKVVFLYEYHFVVWIIVIPTAIATMIYSSRRKKTVSYKTYVGESMSSLWTGIGISFFILSIIISNSIGWLHAYPFFILFYGLGTFISGRILKFTPLVIGGIFNWVLAIACVFFEYDYQLLFAAAAIFTSYVIPGHLLSKEN